ncbi:leucine-rich repeat transmembrane neuronal protein 2-like [Centruroides sculpturatus]|uniref:leucine-rich repeat transmembrane neuronal protein 2-like n=1 Tax=Centruroides sculpturatus TaxID=218467 RepID=UPI000C6EAFCF|nr:leucine-rich repeat transmembrane neuronal protein 2-like [Centruroides sculpturatus]XP_023223468.1 leucine-rich repeat transmembrane neuronal protein 2-like [Centruroides sculpturatus]
MRRLKGSPSIIVLLFYFICLWSEAECGPRTRCRNCECDEINLKVNCDSAQLQTIPIYFNPGLRWLRVTNNQITGIDSIYNSYRNLSYLDISHNEITDLKSEQFTRHSYLETLLISHNMITSFNNRTFVGLVRLKILHLNENHLEDISSMKFSPLKSLEYLDLSRNRISYVDVDAFYGLNNLKSLLLRGNKLSAIPSLSFHHIPNLLSLDIGLNPIDKELVNDSFSSLSNLKDLYLDGCALKKLNSAVFRNLSNLLTLNLGDNKLVDVPTNSFKYIINLEKLILSQNLFNEIPPRAFRGLKRLRKIIVTGCVNLKIIREKSFEDNADLEYIGFDHNRKLTKIEFGAFNGLANIRNVSLRGNAFETFDSRLLSWDELDNMNLSGNPIRCDCNILWMKNLLKSYNSTDNVVCSSPQLVANRRLVNLSNEELGCDSLNGKRQVFICVTVSAAVIIAVLVTLGFKYRTKLAGMLKDRWSGNRKEPHYQKTNSEEESTILQAAQQSLKMTPVTEL